MAFDWHSDLITRDTPVDDTYRNTQNVRRFMTLQCGPSFRFDRPFMAWINNGEPKNMGQVADQWLRLHAAASASN
ncbi:DUF6434 domain-containing protein [Pseudomonas syringae]|uniref:DUF6434 domain-containing protein n=1 Tax=Pseudomonas syringae pv. aceris TaxID=199198 RepID=A0A0L8IXH5_PSESX|nr:DUF6434 domain-containing protein [Pseudomonas syringae]AVB26694.1 hypothetical protein BKC06_017170 [Pseudomonas syringae pv. syringae]EGH72177.1 hypothetical protein PSYAR_16610 [Pseudomonas syringae pv. aceris str. M302273]KOG06101.1 Uncharacterized protein ABJ98_3563 [Pseudomonas syringae pv. aceris]KPB16271.1 Uncharacterized protein AC518_4084 [Pseudomonas syringae pv. syringae]KPW05876.1 Uncharacterized protein ALO91_02902 [Pseudomonas syringae pv. aceris]